MPSPKGVGRTGGVRQVALRPPFGLGFWIGKPGWLPWTGRERVGADLAVTVGTVRCPALAAASVRSSFEGPHAAPSSIPAHFFPLPVAKRAHGGNARPAGRSPRFAAVSPPMTRSRSPSGRSSSATRPDEPFFAFLPSAPVLHKSLQFTPAHFLDSRASSPRRLPGSVQEESGPWRGRLFEAQGRAESWTGSGRRRSLDGLRK